MHAVFEATGGVSIPLDRLPCWFGCCGLVGFGSAVVVVCDRWSVQCRAKDYDGDMSGGASGVCLCLLGPSVPPYRFERRRDVVGVNIR